MGIIWIIWQTVEILYNCNIVLLVLGMGEMSKRKRAFAGRSERVGLTVFELFEKFSSELSARSWFESVLWSEGRYCGHCGGTKTKEVPNEMPMPYWCGECRSYFSVKAGTPMQSSKIPLRKWAVAMYMMTTSLKGVSSMKMHRELGITQSCAWHMIHRIREAWNQDLLDRMAGVVKGMDGKRLTYDELIS